MKKYLRKDRMTERQKNVDDLRLIQYYNNGINKTSMLKSS